MLQALLARSPDSGRQLRSAIYLPAGIGLATGAVILVVAGSVAQVMPTEVPDLETPPWWYGVLASFSAAVNEELLLRLGLMTLLAWLIVPAQAT